MQAVKANTIFTDLHQMILDAMIEKLFNTHNETSMQKLFYIPLKPVQAPDTHHMVDDHYAPEEFENRTEDFEHAAMVIDQHAELTLIEAEN